MTTEPATWWSLTLAAWPLLFALGAVVIVGTAEHWSRILDRLLSTRTCRHELGDMGLAINPQHSCRCVGQHLGHPLPHTCHCGCQWWPIGPRGSGWRRIR